MRFRQISTIFGGFLEDLPFGEHTKDDDQKISPCFRVSREFHRKKSIFHEKMLFLEKAGRPYQKKARKTCRNFLHFWKIGGIFQILNFWSSHITGRFWKIHEKFQFVIFYQKIVMGRKRRISLFQKTRFFAKTFLRFFYFGGLMPKWKNKVEKCPVRNIIFVYNTKNRHFLQNKPVGSEIGQKCKNRKNRCFATAIWTSRTVVTKLRKLQPDAT